MPYPPQVFSLDGHAFGLTVSGVQIIDKVPTDLSPIRWDAPSNSSIGALAFTVEDSGETVLTPGAVVRFTDNVNVETLMAGPLVGRRVTRISGEYRGTECNVVGWGWFLDHREAQSFVIPPSTSNALPVTQLIEQWGGPVHASTAVQNDGSYGTAGGTSTRTSVRSALEYWLNDGAAGAVWDTAYPYYVDNEAELHSWDHTGLAAFYDAAIVGTATSIGDLATFIPEYLTWDQDDEPIIHQVYGYGVNGTAVPGFYPFRGSPTGVNAPWDAGEMTASEDSIYAATAAAVLHSGQLDDWLESFHRAVTSITFTTIEYGGWRPHQEVVVNDSIISGGAASTAYIETVSGSIDDRNVIEWSIGIGAPSRSIVQTIVQK